MRRTITNVMRREDNSLVFVVDSKGYTRIFVRLIEIEDIADEEEEEEA